MLAHNVKQQAVVVRRIACDEAAWVNAGYGIALKVGDYASCFGEDEGCCSIVPWAEDIFKIEFAASHGNIAQFRCTGSEASEVIDLWESLADYCRAYGGVLLMVHRQGGA